MPALKTEASGSILINSDFHIEVGLEIFKELQG